jgi:hypothetical protein
MPVQCGLSQIAHYRSISRLTFVANTRLSQDIRVLIDQEAKTWERQSVTAIRESVQYQRRDGSSPFESRIHSLPGSRWNCSSIPSCPIAGRLPIEVLVRHPPSRPPEWCFLLVESQVDLPGLKADDVVGKKIVFTLQWMHIEKTQVPTSCVHNF